MQTTVLTEVYALLKTIGAVANEAEFSRDWLGGIGWVGVKAMLVG